MASRFVYLVEVTDVYKMKTTERVSGVGIDSVWTRLEPAKDRAAQIANADRNSQRESYRHYKRASVRTAALEPERLLDTTSFSPGYGDEPPSRWENNGNYEVEKDSFRELLPDEKGWA